MYFVSLVMRRSQTIVYVARNIHTDKAYIGWCTDFKERKARHLREAAKGTRTRFYNAIRKYGPEAFEWSILFDSLPNYEECKKMERRLIALFNTYHDGYNATQGGDGGFTGINSGVFKKGIKPWCTGKKLTPDHIENLRKSHRGLTQSKDQISKRVLKLVGLKKSDAAKQKIREKLNKKTIQMSMSGEFIASYPSVNDAFITTGINNIASVCRGVVNSAGGFKWKYHER